MLQLHCCPAREVSTGTELVTSRPAGPSVSGLALTRSRLASQLCANCVPIGTVRLQPECACCLKVVPAERSDSVSAAVQSCASAKIA